MKREKRRESLTSEIDDVGRGTAHNIDQFHFSRFVEENILSCQISMDLQTERSRRENVPFPLRLTIDG